MMIISRVRELHKNNEIWWEVQYQNWLGHWCNHGMRYGLSTIPIKYATKEEAIAEAKRIAGNFDVDAINVWSSEKVEETNDKEEPWKIIERETHNGK